MLVKLKAPVNAGPITYAGADYPVRPDGSIEVPDALWPALSSHGFSMWVEPADFFSTLNRNECFHWAKENGLRLTTPITALGAQQACREHAAAMPVKASPVVVDPRAYDHTESGPVEVAEPEGSAPPAAA